MTERAFANLDLWMWEYPDNPRNYPGVHLTGRTAACDTLAEWLIRMQETPGRVRTEALHFTPQFCKNGHRGIVK